MTVSSTARKVLSGVLGLAVWLAAATSIAAGTGQSAALPYRPMNMPLGSGPHKAIMTADPALSGHVIYQPADLAEAGPMPIILWGNGGCLNAGNRFRYLLTEIASHGYLVVAAGAMGPVVLERGPAQGGTPLTMPGSPQPAQTSARPSDTGPAKLTEALDWAIAENGRTGGPYYHKLDVTKVAVAGQSCGGWMAFQIGDDPRVSTIVLLHSSGGMAPGATNYPSYDRARPKQTVMPLIRVPILYLHGDPKLDVSHQGAVETFNGVSGVPQFLAWRDGIPHRGDFDLLNGGPDAPITVAWLDWWLKGDRHGASLFEGDDCLLCRDPKWHVSRKDMH